MVLPQRHRLRGRGVFDYLYKRGRRIHLGVLLLRVAPAAPELLRPSTREPESLRFAVVISSKVSKRAVVRNRLRRRLHDNFVQNCHPKTGRIRADLTPSWLLLSLKPDAAALGDDGLLREWNGLLQQAGLIDDGNPHHPQ
ncbi:MAG: hypothetical protein CBB79_10585 [Synechococcus sp. TMED19]|nr:MAG: hypothetical protein CBB79_10585 [Synechococcus sp. TMED19]